MHSFRDLTLQRKYSTGKDQEPLEFYSLVIPNSKTLYFKLGYFSSYSISVLAVPLTYFLLNGGVLNIITNHIYNIKDAENLLDLDLSDKKLEDIGKIYHDHPQEFMDHLKQGTSLFYDCLNYLQVHGRLRIQPVLFGEDYALSHFKEFIAEDFNGDLINATGSCNMTPNGILRNGESFMVLKSWADDEKDLTTIQQEKEEIISILENRHEDFHYASKDQIEQVIKEKASNKELKDLFDQANSLRSKIIHKSNLKLIYRSLDEGLEQSFERFRNTPRKPSWFEPRQYQIDAYHNWVTNNKSGVFAMATGTGKTLTALNCLINETLIDGYYRTIILVPSIALLNQWLKDIEQFNFKNILLVGGGNKWESELANYISDFKWGLKKDLLILGTYNSFVLEKFQKLFNQVHTEFLLVADEAHNLGAPRNREALSKLTIPRKIALSATPKRVYDIEGTTAIDNYFNDSPPYTYSFEMSKALELGFLTSYKYFPRIIELQNDELEEYKEISVKLLHFFDTEKGEFRNDPMVEILLLKRKNIIHKAKNKLAMLLGIIKELIKKEKDKYIFVYVPEGFVSGESEDKSRIIDQYIRETNALFPKLKLNSYTADDQDHGVLLKGFSEARIDILFAMKMLDEGVDVPRAEIGIFASSTGNPRQFIQRRGRLLRNHKDKSLATIYDIVVVPKINSISSELFNVERNLVKNELTRVGYFASLSTNYYDSKNELSDICSKYNLDLDTIINEL